MPENSGHFSALFIELGLIIAGLAVLARLAKRYGISAIPLYLLAGLAFGKGGLTPLHVSEQFTRIGSEIGVLLLLFMLGLEYTGEELGRSLKSGIVAGAIDFALNFAPGFIAGLLLHWSPLSSALLGGVTYISSSGIIARVLGELKRFGNPETPALLSILVLEDLAMAVYLPVVAVLLAGGSPFRMVASVSIALLAVVAVLFVAIRYGRSISAIVRNCSSDHFRSGPTGCRASPTAQCFLCDWSVSGGHRHLRNHCPPGGASARPFARPVRSHIFLFLRNGSRPFESSNRFAAGRASRRHHSRHQDSDRIFGGEASGMRPARCLARRVHSYCARRILDCDRRTRDWP